MSELELTIDDLSHEGRGVAHVDGKAWFVAGALPGERVRARRTAKHRQYDEAEVLEVLEASPDRVVPTCPHFGTCAGCSLQHLAPAAQIAAKQRTLLETSSASVTSRPRACSRRCRARPGAIAAAVGCRPSG